MKKYLFTMSAVAMLFATSCQNDLDMPQGAGETATVAFNISTPEIATRAYSDGQTATHLQYAVYKADGTILRDLTNTNDEIHGSTTVDLKLTTGNTYTVVFWAAAPNAPYAVDFGDELAEADMTVVYDGAKSNDENRDAFYAVKEFKVNGAMSVDVDLYRPFAQINIGTSDYAYSESAGYTPTKSAVTVKGLGTTLNFKSGEVSGEAKARVFGEALIDKNETFPVEGYEYLAMNYVLVNNVKSLVDVEFTYTDDSADAKTRTVGSVPVQRNYRTNIYGQLLTSDVDINVEIVPAYNEPAHGLAELQYAALNGGEVTLTENVELTTPLEVYGKMTLNLNGHNIVNKTKSAVYGKGEGIIVYGDLTINGEGTVKGCTRALWARGGNGGAKITINGGTYEGAEDGYAEGGCSVVYASSGNTINIYGGSVQALAADESSYASDLYAALNVADNKGIINVYGGRFYKQNPAAPGTEPSAWIAAHPNGFVAEGYGVYANGDWFEVMYTGGNATVDAVVNNANELNDAISKGKKVIVLAEGNYGTINATEGITYIGTANAKIDCVNLNGAYNVTLRNITFDAATAKMSCDGNGKAKQNANIISGDNVNKPNKGSRNLVIDGCKFTGTFANGGAAIAFTDQSRGAGQSGNITIKNCTFDIEGAYYEIYGHYFGYGKLVIENNTFKSIVHPQGYPVYLGRYQSSTPVVVKGNRFETKASLEDAIYVQDHSNYGVSVDASGNTFAN